MLATMREQWRVRTSALLQQVLDSSRCDSSDNTYQTDMFKAGGLAKFETSQKYAAWQEKAAWRHSRHLLKRSQWLDTAADSEERVPDENDLNAGSQHDRRRRLASLTPLTSPLSFFESEG